MQRISSVRQGYPLVLCNRGTKDTRAEQKDRLYGAVLQIYGKIYIY